MSKIKEFMLLALVADGPIEMKIADAGKGVNTIYDALKANGLLVASGKKTAAAQKVSCQPRFHASQAECGAALGRELRP